MATVSVTAAWLASKRWTVQASIGAVLDGQLQVSPVETYDVEPGAIAALGVNYRAVQADHLVPFVDLSMTVGASWAETIAPDGTSASYLATDARLGVRAGWNVKDTAFPYVAVRAFGGPVQWEYAGEDVAGADIYHYQLALGATGMIGPVALFVEWSGLGEKAISSGVGFAF